MPRIATHCTCCLNHNLDRQPAVLMPFVAKRAFGWDSCEIGPDWGLRDIPQGHAHALCSSLHCPSCGFLFLDMRFDSYEMRRLYEDYRGPAYVAMREAFEPGYRHRNEQLVLGDRHLPEVEKFLAAWVTECPSILDWGGDTGLNTPFRATARTHHVLEISGKSTIPGAQAVSQTTLEPNGYDLVILSNVLEHVPEPVELLADVKKSLGPKGRLYVEVPFESLMRIVEREPAAWRKKRHWHEHVNFFSQKSLLKLLHQCGLKVLEICPIEIPDENEPPIQLGVVCEAS